MRRVILIDLFNQCLGVTTFGKLNHIVVVEHAGFARSRLLKLHDKFARHTQDGLTEDELELFRLDQEKEDDQGARAEGKACREEAASPFKKRVPGCFSSGLV